MTSYQNAEHNTNRKPTPQMRVLDDLDDGKTPRAPAKVIADSRKPIMTDIRKACQCSQASPDEYFR